MRITLVIPSFECGGVERVVSTLANYWARKKWAVTLITLQLTPPSVFWDSYTLHPGVTRIDLGPTGNPANPLAAIANKLRRLSKLRSEIKRSRPDAVISCMQKANVAVLLATRGLGLKVIVSEDIDPAMHHIGKVWNWLRKVSYPKADVVVVLSVRTSNWIKKNIGEDTPVVVIGNPVYHYKEETGNERPLSAITGGTAPVRTFVAMGRLHPQKGFDILLKTFAGLTHRYPEWKLVIFGEGPERKNLTELADSLNIAGKVHFPGRVNAPMWYFQQADIFVMSSRYEGFPMALLEAMACGLPVISFDCPTGPREIIRDGVDGILVPPEDVDALSRAMERLINDESGRKRLASRAVEVVERFSLEKIMGLWENVIGHKY